MLNILEMWFRMLNAPFPSFPSAGAEKLPALLFAFVTCSERGQAVRSAAGPFRGFGAAAWVLLHSRELCGGVRMESARGPQLHQEGRQLPSPAEDLWVPRHPVCEEELPVLPLKLCRGSQ